MSCISLRAQCPLLKLGPKFSQVSVLQARPDQGKLEWVGVLVRNVAISFIAADLHRVSLSLLIFIELICIQE